ncbi:PREDICTED: protein FAM170A-like [Elephantulus edwardii]|uniref:protein FAM170A-like n=1 Tax=Elephantulus edwardii TaxID=28737 RepID=UPI0003F07D73|nr:PREDICTED: protein FAM170A-like [Elephantulus edwardii]
MIWSPCAWEPSVGGDHSLGTCSPTLAVPSPPMPTPTIYFFSCASVNIWVFLGNALHHPLDVLLAKIKDSKHSFAAEYSDAVSSKSILVPLNENGTHQVLQNNEGVAATEKPQPLESEKGNTSSPFPYFSVPYCTGDECSVPSKKGTNQEKIMNLYYMHVQKRKGMAILGLKEEVLESPKKKPRMEEFFILEINTESDLPKVVPDTSALVNQSAYSLGLGIQEEREKNIINPAETLALEVNPSCLLTTDCFQMHDLLLGLPQSKSS